MDNNQEKNSYFISFQDSPPNNQSGSGNQPQFDLGTPTQQAYGNLSATNDAPGIGILEDLQGMPNKNEEQQQRSFWTIEYYQKYFNVKTNDVVERIKRSMVPHGSDNYLVTHIRPNPDLYGPFWICITLIFAVAISVNVANYLQTAGITTNHWKYDFHVVSYAATCIFLYAWLLPLGLWGALKWTTSNKDTEAELIEAYATPGLLELLCLYGYSLAIFVPVTFLWTIQLGWLQWTLVGIATFLSGGVLLRSLLPVIAGKHKIIYIAVILGMHLVLAAGFMLYFFHVPSTTIPPPSKLVTTVAPVEAVTKHLVEAVTNASKVVKSQ